MNAHLGKPLDFNLVLETILTLTGHEPSLSSVGTHRDPSDKLQQVLSRFGGNEQLYRKLLQGFMPSFLELNQSLNQAINHQHWSEVMTILHTMKGSAGTAGLDELFEWLKNKEAELKKVDIAEQGTELLTGVVDAIAKQAAQEHQTLMTSLGSNESIMPVVESSLDVQSVWSELEECLATGNMKALELAELLQRHYPDNQSYQALLVAVENLEFESARQWLTQIREGHVT